MMPPESKDKKKKQKGDNQTKEDMPTTSQTKWDTKGVPSKSTAVDRSSSPEKNMDELWEECLSFTEELEELQKEKKHLTIETALKSSENFEEQRNIERTKAKIREKLGLKQERERCCRAEIEEHRQKLAQLESAHHSDISELKISAIAVTSKTHVEHMGSEVELQKKVNLIQMEEGEKQALIDISIRQHKMKHLAGLREYKQSNVTQDQEIEAQYVQKIRNMVRKKKKETSTKVKETDVHMKALAERVIEEHEDVRRAIKNQEDNKKTRKGEFEALKKEVVRQQTLITARRQKGKHLEESLLEMESKLSESNSKLTVQRKAMVEGLKRSKKITTRVLKERHDLYLKHQLLELKYVQAQQEHEELQGKNAKALQDVQQKSCLKVLVLERQIKTVTEILGKEQLKLWVALAFRLGDQTAANNIEALFKSKHATIEALKDDISGDLMEYNKLVVKATASEPSVDKWLSIGVMEKSIRRVLEDSKKSVNLIQELMGFCISEDKDFLALNPAGAESRQ